MNPAEIKPRWIRELERLAGYKTQLYLYGNIKDTMLYPLGADQQSWTLGPVRDALFEILRNQLGPYNIIGAYNPVDGMVFADARDKNSTMAELYDEIVASGDTAEGEEPKGRAPRPSKPQDPLGQAIQQIRLCLRNRQHPCVFVIENASQLLSAPVNLQQAERNSFLRLLKSSSESQMIATGTGDQRRVVQNMLILLCDKLTDLPPWLYLNNPFAGSIPIETPRSSERRHFFEMFLLNGTPEEQSLDTHDLVDLTDGMTVRDLCGIRSLARRSEEFNKNAKSLVDCYKYGIKESEWDNLDWQRLDEAEKILEHRVMGQPAAVSAASDMLRRARLSLSGAQHSSRTKPRGVLFFAGPTGVGKTELAKAIAELIFRTEEACVRFDMSEFSLPSADQRLLGAPPGYLGYEEGGQLTNRMKINPFCVLLFDEIEKAHPSILDKFLQILEDGRMTDGRGETVYFAESIIIFTSNIGIYQLDSATGRPMVDPFDGHPLLNVDPNVDTEYDVVRDKILEGVHDYFKHILGRPELLNRIGQNIIVFDFVRPPVMRQILERKVLVSIQSQIEDRWKVHVEFSANVVDQLMEIIGMDVSSGGRGVGNLVETAVLNPLARVLYQLLGQEQTVTGKCLHVNNLVLPKDTPDHRYDIIWELAQTPSISTPANA